MNKRIMEYQKAFSTMIEILQENSNVLAVTVFGSMITGDIWEDSDIDLFVIVKDWENGIEDVYGEQLGIPMHFKILSKYEFLNLTTKHIGGSTIHRKFISSKLVLSKDEDITEKFNVIKYYSDLDRERWTLVYLGKLLKDIASCEKYLHNGKIYSPFTTMVSAIDNFSRLYLNYNGYLVSKTSTSVLVKLNDEYEKLINNLMKEVTKENINEILRYMEEFIDNNIIKCCKVLIEYLEENNTWVSSQEVKKSIFFNEFNIEMEEILGELSKKKIVEKSTREYKELLGDRFINELVYKINTK